MDRSVKGFLLSLALFLPLQLYLVLSWMPKFLKLSGGIINLDARFSYTTAEVNILMTELGKNGINHYYHGVAIDFVYALFMGLLVYFLLKMARGKRVKSVILIRLTYIIPSLYIICDWFENSGIIYYINTYPKNIYGVRLFSLFTTFKQLLPFVAAAYLFLLIAIRIYIRIKSK